MKNEDDLYEMRMDMIRESKEDELHEYNMRTDLDFFSEQYSEEIEEYTRLYNLLHKALSDNDWHSVEVDDLRE